jgi:membrane protein DedA with SNARE-associated domain
MPLEFMQLLNNLSVGLGPFGTFISMFLVSSVVPIPSEVVLFGAGVASSNPLEVAVYGSLGSSLGAIVAYFIGKRYGRKIMSSIGKYFFITKRIENVLTYWFKKYGNTAILCGRLIPIIPHKVFSILAGVSNMNFKNFFIFTLIGTIARSFFLVYFGNVLNKLNNMWIISLSVLLVFILPLLFSKIAERLKF